MASFSKQLANVTFDHHKMPKLRLGLRFQECRLFAEAPRYICVHVCAHVYAHVYAHVHAVCCVLCAFNVAPIAAKTNSGRST